MEALPKFSEDRRKVAVPIQGDGAGEIGTACLLREEGVSHVSPLRPLVLS
jgi:hypothetical protein